MGQLGFKVAAGKGTPGAFRIDFIFNFVYPNHVKNEAMEAEYSSM